MDEGTTGVLDRPPLLEDPKKMLELRDKARREHYPEFAKMVKEDKSDENQNVREMYNLMDRKVEALVAEFAQKERETVEKDIPDIVLRHKDKESREIFMSLGWDEWNIKAVISKLKDRLEIGENEAMNTIHILVAKNRRAEEVLSTLNDDTKYAKYDYTTEEGQKLLVDRFNVEQRMEGTTHKRVQDFVYIQNELEIENNSYIERFILDEDYGKELNRQYRHDYVDNLYDLAWNIGFSEKNEFGVNGLYPVLQMQVQKIKDTETGKERIDGRYVVNQANYMRWMRKKMYKAFSEMDTDVLTNYFSELKVDKGNFTAVTLGQMIVESDTYFRDETGHKWDRLYDQALLEPWMLMTLRQYYLEYEKAMGSEEELAKAYNNDFYLSKLTRKIYGKSMMNMVMTLAEDFDGRDSDTKLGEAWTKIYLAYYNMADFKELKNILGEESDFFKKEGWIKAILETHKAEIDQTGMPAIGKFLGDKEEEFNRAFGKDGKIADEKAFINLINIYPSPTTSSTVVEVVNQALKDAVEDQLVSKEANLNSKEVDKDAIVEGNKIKDKISLNFAWLLARTFTFPTGVAARNNFPSASGHNAETKWLYTYAYRMKYAGYGGAGNPYTIPMFKQLSIPLLEGILLENTSEAYEVYDEKSGNLITKYRQMTPMEVIRQMHATSEKWEDERKEQRGKLAKAKERNDIGEQARIQERLDEIDEFAKNDYKLKAGQLVFQENAMRNWAQNIVGRGKVLYENVMGAHEIAFDKFTKYDGIFRGVSFDRAEWQKAMQGGLITPLRYLFDANNATQLNMKVRSPVYKGRDDKGKPKWEFEDMYLGEAMLGHQIVDIPQFRMTRKDISAEKWKELESQGHSWNGRYIVRPDGKNLLDYNKMQENKTLVYKQWMLMKLAGDLWTHIDVHSTDPAYGMEHYMSVLDAIATLPGDIDGDEYDLQGVSVPKYFFSKEQMKWLKEISGTTSTKLFFRQFFKDLFQGDPKKQESKFGESFSIIIGTIFKGF